MIFKKIIYHGKKLIIKNVTHTNVIKKENTKLQELAKEALFLPENATADKALRHLLSEHCQLSMVVDEFGSVVGVLAMEDIIESIIGQEIFEPDDLAVDMRELAKRKHEVQISEKNEPQEKN